MRDRDTNPRGQVTELQHFLSDYYDLEPEDIMTGYFGRLTHQTVQRFQREQGLPSYGIVGSLTRAAIARVCGGETPHTGALSVTPSSGTAPLTVTATAESGSSCSPYTISWGDGTTDTNPGSSPDLECAQRTVQVSKTHTYTRAGTYTVSFTKGTTAHLATVSVTASPPAQTPTLSARPQSGTAPLAVTFTAGNLVSDFAYTIDFGDGSTEPLTVPPVRCVSAPCTSTRTVSHTYSTAGTFTASISSKNAPVSATAQVTVRGQQGGGSEHVPTLSVSPQSGEAPLSVELIANIEPGVRYTLLFGDGQSQSVMSFAQCSRIGNAACTVTNTVRHTYASEGTYRPSIAKADGGTASFATVMVTRTQVPGGSLSVTPSSGTAPLTVTATAESGSSCSPYTISWGDGTTDTNPGSSPDLECAQRTVQVSKTHTYTRAGTYTVSFTQGTTARMATVVVGAAQTNAQVSLTATPTSGIAPLTVNFTGVTHRTSTIDFGDGVMRAVTNFADPVALAGSVSMYAPFGESYTYQRPGTYTVRLTSNGTETRTVTVTVTAQQPTPTLTVTPSSGTAPLTVTATTESGSSCAPYTITWGDGTTDTNPGSSPDLECAQRTVQVSRTHTYTRAGTYTVSFTQGTTARMATVVVGAAQTNAQVSLTATPTSGIAPLTVNFTGVTHRMSTIDFGDGVMRAVTNFADPVAGSMSTYAPFGESYTYQRPGTYTVRLTSNGTEIRTVTVTVMAQQSTGTLSVTPSSGTAPLTVTATAESGSSCSPYTISWGDGTTDTNPGSSPDLECAQRTVQVSKTHTYTRAGTYTVSFTQGTTARMATVVVGAGSVTEPTGASASPASGRAPLTVTLTHWTDSAADSNWVRVDFGDGTTGWATRAAANTYTATHQYTNPGIYAAIFYRGQNCLAGACASVGEAARVQVTVL